MKVYCCCCCRQVISSKYNINDKHVIDNNYAKAGFKPGEVFCRDCGKDLDENGLFPEERAEIGK